MRRLPGTPRVTALIVSYNTRALLLEAIASLDPGTAVVVVDNASVDGSATAATTTFPRATVIASPQNLGFAAGVNLAARNAASEFLLLLNPDARLQPGALDLLQQTLVRLPHAAAVGPRLCNSDGSYQPSAFMFPGLGQVALDLFTIPRLTQSRLNGRYTRREGTRYVDVLLGACLLVRREAWADIGQFDESYFMYVEEVDWCRRARLRRWQIVYEPRAAALHHSGQSTVQQADRMFAELWRSRLHYYRKFGSPAYQRLVHVLVRAGMRAEKRRATGTLQGEYLRTRLAAIESVCALVA